MCCSCFSIWLARLERLSRNFLQLSRVLQFMEDARRPSNDVVDVVEEEYRFLSAWFMRFLHILKDFAMLSGFLLSGLC